MPALGRLATTAARAYGFLGRALARADEFFEYTTLLLPGNGTNGAQNNTFLDSSTNNFTITRNGNTTQGTFSPFSQTGWGNYFDGSNDWLEVSTSATTFASSNFTVEFWLYYLGNGWVYANYRSDPSSVNGTEIQITGANLTFNAYQGSTSPALSLGAAHGMQIGTWNHIAVTRSSSAFTLWINGLSSATGSYAPALNAPDGAVTYIARRNWQGNANYLTGYLSNFRVVIGTAVYTANFTPPTTPLTAISGTSLLTCQSNRFIDNSSNNFAITRNGDTSVQAFSPFNPTAAWSAATNGGSGYFDGSGDYLSVANSSNYALGTDNFTIELWVYPTATFASDQVLFSHGYVSYCPWLMYTSTGGALVGYASSTGSSWDILSGNSFGTLRTGAWNHVALCRSGSTFYLCMNGVVTTTATSSAALMSIASGLMIGATTSGLNIIGSSYITNARIIKGAALYTSSYTPPTAPLTAISGTQFLLSATNAGIYDATSKNDLETVGNAQISTTQSKFGGSSISFDGTGDYLLPNSPSSNVLPAFGSGDFTVEYWVRFAALGDVTVFDTRPSSTNGAYATMYIDVGTNKIIYFADSANRITSSTVFATNTWYHIAVVRSSGSTKMYVNGTNEGATYTDGNNYLGVANRPVIGANGFNLGNNAMNGFIQDFRITRGYARYTTNFTPPTAAFPLL